MVPWQRATVKAKSQALKLKIKSKPVAKAKTKPKPVAKAKKSKPVAKGSRCPGVSGVDTIPTTDDSLTDLDRLSAPGVPGSPTTDDSHPDPDIASAAAALVELELNEARLLSATSMPPEDTAHLYNVALADLALREAVMYMRVNWLADSWRSDLTRFSERDS